MTGRSVFVVEYTMIVELVESEWSNKRKAHPSRIGSRRVTQLSNAHVDWGRAPSHPHGYLNTSDVGPDVSITDHSEDIHLLGLSSRFPFITFEDGGVYVTLGNA